MKLLEQYYPWVFTGVCICFGMILFSTLLMDSSWDGYLMLGLPTAIMAFGDSILQYCKEDKITLPIQGIFLWGGMAFLLSSNEAGILFFRQFDITILLIEVICTCLAILFILVEDKAMDLRHSMSKLLFKILRIGNMVPILAYLILVVIKAQVMAYVYLLLTVIVFVIDFIVIQKLTEKSRHH